MKLAPALALFVAAGLARDTSWHSPSVDVSKFVLLKSVGPARSSTLSPAGNVFAHYEGNKVTLYDVKDQKELRDLTGHIGNIHDSGWSRDGKTFVTSGYDGVVKVWDVATGRNLASFAAHSGYA